MDDNLLAPDTYSLKHLFNEPLYLIKQEFTEILPVLEKTPETAETIMEQKENKLFVFTGNNLKNTVFIVFSDDKDIPAIDKLLYTKTLTALKLSENEVALCVSSIEHIRNFEQIAKEFPSQKVICFAESANYGPELLSVKTIDSTMVYFCPSLSELQLNQELKIKWWNGLKSFIA
jgi:hypothetical protein